MIFFFFTVLFSCSYYYTGSCFIVSLFLDLIQTTLVSFQRSLPGLSWKNAKLKNWRKKNNFKPRSAFKWLYYHLRLYHFSVFLFFASFKKLRQVASDRKIKNHVNKYIRTYPKFPPLKSLYVGMKEEVHKNKLKSLYQTVHAKYQKS